MLVLSDVICIREDLAQASRALFSKCSNRGVGKLFSKVVATTFRTRKSQASQKGNARYECFHAELLQQEPWPCRFEWKGQCTGEYILA